MAGWILIAVCGIAVVCAAYASTRREQRLFDRFEQRRAKRADQTPIEFAAECGDDIAGDVAERVRRILAKVSDLSYSLPEQTVEPARLRASDDICADLGYDLDSLSFAQLYTELEREFGIHMVFDFNAFGLTPGEPLTVAKLTRVIVAEIKKPKPELDASFQPGFRISVLDGIVLVAGAVGAMTTWQYFPWLGYSIACVVGHFFLFCNVVRMSRGLELLWSLVFLAWTCFAVFQEEPYWWSVAVLGTFAATVICVVVAMLKRSYHGVFWHKINPRLPEWWVTYRDRP